MVMCFALTCKHYSESHNCRFFVFPKNKTELKKWLTLIRRYDREPSKHSRVCSCHFLNGDRNFPTCFDFNEGKQLLGSGETFKVKRRKVTEPETEAGSSDLRAMDTDDENAGTEDIVLQTESSDFKMEIPQQHPPSFSAMLEAENYILKQEIDSLKKQMNDFRLSFSFRQIENSDHLIAMYAGLPTKDTFLSLFTLFKGKEINYYAGWKVTKIPQVDQLLLTLMKLRLNLLNDDLAHRFNISRETVSNIFKTWLFALYEILFNQLMSEIPSRNKNRMFMPASFSSFTNCRVIIDCTEVTTIRPKNMEKQRVTYIAYKHKNTLKALVGVAPNGVITFVSKLYPGSTSDKRITKHCGILSKLSPGDLVLADKGFLSSDLLPEGVSMKVPPFLVTNQFTPEQVMRTQTIASARIHVERAINRIKLFTILNALPAALIPHASVVFQVCAALTNLQFPLIKEVEYKYDY